MTPEHELAELRSKVEEFRKSSLWDRSETCTPCGALRMEFDYLFPPPRKGCWGFWRDSSVTGNRIFRGYYGKAEAENGWAMLSKDWNPSPVFFLPEEK